MNKSGVYVIYLLDSDDCYIGSSKQISVRWQQHKRHLRTGSHHSEHLQRAWNKYGEPAFAMRVLEECSIADLMLREQWYLDTLQPVFNVCPQARSREGSKQTPEAIAKIKAWGAQAAAARTHCPHGHEYTPDNVYMGKKPGDKRCKACNRERVAAIYAAETPEQTAARLKKDNDAYYANYEKARAQRNEYSARTREAKNAYDIAYRPIKNARRRAVTAALRAAKPE